MIILFLIVLFTGCSNGINNKVGNNSSNNQKTVNPESTKVVQPTSRPSPKIQANDYKLIIISDFLMGSSKNKEWVNLDQTEKQVRGGEKYRIYSSDGFLGTGIGSEVTISQPGSTKMISVDAKIKLSNEYIAINGDWNALPRVVKLQSINSTTYKEVLTNILVENNLKDVAPRIKQNFRVDLDGDGVEEVLISAHNIDKLGANYKKGTFSLVFIRKIINGSVKNILLEKNFYVKDGDLTEGGPIVYEIIGIADLNGDNNMETIIKYKYYEGYGYNIYEVKNDKIKTVLSNGLGA